jgi:hypothetical protein
MCPWDVLLHVPLTDPLHHFPPILYCSTAETEEATGGSWGEVTGTVEDAAAAAAAEAAAPAAAADAPEGAEVEATPEEPPVEEVQVRQADRNHNLYTAGVFCYVLLA